MDENIKKAYFGGGCFWCTEAVFKMLRGVKSVTPGYAGGTVPNPTYYQVASGDTGHAEVIKIEFDQSEITFKELLSVFFGTHDPTTPNRQGADVGTEYRSLILYADENQKKEAEDYIASLNNSSKDGTPIVTEVKPLEKFYEAEDYHKNYYEKNQSAMYCQIVINPKLEKAKRDFAEFLKKNS